jgi:hypothetical protein
MPSNDPWIKAMLSVVGLVGLAMGVLMLKTKPYQPKD